MSASIGWMEHACWLVSHPCPYTLSSDIDFIRVDGFPVIDAIRKQALDWVTRYGEILRDMAETQLHKVQDEIKLHATNLQRECVGIDELKFVLHAIGEIHAVNMDMELQFEEVMEKFRTLSMYGIPVKRADGEAVDHLSDTWSQLLSDAHRRDAGLVAVKSKFTEITRTQIVTFQADLKRMRARFELAGPGTADCDLDEGLERMKNFRQEIRELVRYAAVLLYMPYHVTCPAT